MSGKVHKLKKYRAAMLRTNQGISGNFFQAIGKLLPFCTPALKSLFVAHGASTPQAKPDNRPLVNYIWVNHRKTETDPDNPICAIEMGNIKTAVNNANKYPDADFRLWVDKKLMDDYTVFCIESYIEDHSRSGNISLCNLQDIPDYAGDPYFVPLTPKDKGYLSCEFSRGGPRNVYSRADYARILVLDHCLQTEPGRSRIIYSDIDCPDIRLPEALALMRKHGVAIHDLGSDCVSHGYIGIAADNATVREKFSALKKATRKLAHADELGFPAFEKYLKKLRMPNNRWHDTIGLPDLLPDIGTAPCHVSYTPKRSFEAWRGVAMPANAQMAAAAPQQSPQPAQPL